MENEIDLDKLEEEFEAGFQEEETADEETQEEDVETDEQTDLDSLEADEDSELEETTDEEQQEDTTQEETETDEQDQKPNIELENYQRQVQELQRQLDESKRAADLIDDIATQSGVSRDELIKRFEQSQLEDQAKAQSVPVEFLKKQRDMEAELSSLRDNQTRDKFNSQVASVRDKFNLSEEDIRGTIDYSIQSGIDVFNPSISFEALYKAANFDKLVEKQVKETRQKELAAKQERMKKSAVSHGGSASPAAPSVDDEVSSFLREQGII